MRHIKTEIQIDANPETIWNILMDFENYSNWNPFMKSIQGEKIVGAKLKVTIQPSNGKEMTFKPEILEFEPKKKLKWFGKGPIRGLFDGVHSFELDKLDNGKVKFRHEEKFTGLLVGISKKMLDKTEQGFIDMNEALKRESEKKK